MDKKSAYRIYLRSTTFECVIASIMSTYFIVYLISNITTSEKAFINIVGCLLGVLTTSLLRKRTTLSLVRKHYIKISICTVILEIVMAITLVYDPFISGVINTITGSMAWTFLENIDSDIYNRLFKGKARTLLDQTLSIYRRLALVLGASTVLVIDTYFTIDVYSVGIMSVITITTLVILDGINITILEKALKNK